MVVDIYYRWKSPSSVTWQFVTTWPVGEMITPLPPVHRFVSRPSLEDTYLRLIEEERR